MQGVGTGIYRWQRAMFWSNIKIRLWKDTKSMERTREEISKTIYREYRESWLQERKGETQTA